MTEEKKIKFAIDRFSFPKDKNYTILADILIIDIGLIISNIEIVFDSIVKKDGKINISSIGFTTDNYGKSGIYWKNLDILSQMYAFVHDFFSDMYMANFPIKIKNRYEEFSPAD